MARAKLWTILAVGCFTGFSFACLVTGPFSNPGGAEGGRAAGGGRENADGPTEVSAELELQPDEKRLGEIFARTSRSVVFISNDVQNGNAARCRGTAGVHRKAMGEFTSGRQKYMSDETVVMEPGDRKGSLAVAHQNKSFLIDPG